MLSKGRKKLQNSSKKGESTTKLLRNKFISLSVVKQPPAKKHVVRNTKTYIPKKSKIYKSYNEKMNLKLHNEYNIKQKPKDSSAARQISQAAALVYT
jgi:hypothetical protein